MEETLHIDSSSIASILGTVGSPLIVVSELIKNAIDASADNVKVSYSRETQTISVVDDGFGFSLNDIRQLSQPGFSKKKNSGNLTNAKGSFYTGSKGLGLLSVFSLCDHLTIQTKSVDGEYLINWSKDAGSYVYEQIIDSKMQEGTIIVLNNIYPQVMTLLTSESEVKKLRHISTYLYKHANLPFPEITLCIDGSTPNSLLFTTEFTDMLFDVAFNYDSKTGKLFFQCISDNPQINNSEIIIDSFDTKKIEFVLDKYFNIKETIKTRTNDNISFKELESIEGVPTFEGRLLVYEKKTAGGMLKDYGAGVNIYTNDFALYNYLSEELDWLGLADFSQRKKATRLKPHNVFGFVNMIHFDETQEHLKISNERADFIQDSVFVKLMYLMKGVIMFMILNIDVAEKNPKYKRADTNNPTGSGAGNSYKPTNSHTEAQQETSPNAKANYDASVEDNSTSTEGKDSGNSERGGTVEQGSKEQYNGESKGEVNEGEVDGQNRKTSDNDYAEDEQEENYEPETVFKPQHRKRHNLTFTASEGQLIDTLKNTNDLGNKIYQTVCELSKLNVLFYPYATVCLYRTLIESATQYASSKTGAAYMETALPTSICNVLNKWSNYPDTSKEFKSNVGLWRDLVNKRNLTDKLNLYIHNVTPVDVDLIIDTWKSMKGYIRQCIKC